MNRLIAVLFILSLVFPAHAGNGLVTVKSVTNNGNGSYTLGINSTTGMSQGDHFGARIGSLTGRGGIWEITSVVHGTAIIVSETLTEAEGGAFGAPIDESVAWYSTPSAFDTTPEPYNAKPWDAAGRRNIFLVATAIDGIADLPVLTPVDGGFVVGDGTDFQVETGATARASMGVTIGSQVQAWDEELDDIAALTPTLNNFILGSGSAWTLADATAARTALGLVIGTNVQAFDAQLTDVAGLTPSDGNFIVGDGVNFVAESGATARASLGLTIGTNVQAFDEELSDIAGLTPTDNSLVTGSGSALQMETLTSLIDSVAGNSRGNILYRNATVWTVLAPGVDGQQLTTHGAGADVTWEDDAGGGGGGGEDLADTLVIGNTSGGTDIVMSADDQLQVDGGTTANPGLVGEAGQGIVMDGGDAVEVVNAAGTSLATVSATGIETTNIVSANNWRSGTAAITTLYNIPLNAAHRRTITISAAIGGSGTEIIQVDTGTMSASNIRATVIDITVTGGPHTISFHADWLWDGDLKPTTVSAGRYRLFLDACGSAQSDVFAGWRVYGDGS